jgi:YihY family inner membrane protein
VHAPVRSVKRFYWKAYEDNLTGLAGMVAYNLLLSILPLGLVALFIAGQVLQSTDFEQSVLADLRGIFPTAADTTLTQALDRVQGFSGPIGIAALVASVWIGSSFWGALDTAFCRIYHVECRGWLRQKRFALLMLAVVLVFFAATIAVPTLQSILVKGTGALPFGLAGVRELVYGITLVAGLVLLFGILCLIYWTVPNEPVPWPAVWPGALAATLVIAAVDYAFPFYLSNINTVARFGTTLVFVLIVLVWFYVLAIVILGGAVMNALRFEALDHRPPSPAAASAAELAGE